ncbi:hypothetical protein M0R45_020142 [Rubus argutus]|uniref:Pentatricopeptide repeat-containing protein n=1 Tax=Rubus argutus TaxID=59490 RepID=A0AAW1XAQ7_RUBAR
MESVVNLQHCHCKLAPTWRFKHCSFLFPKTLTAKPSTKTKSFLCTLSRCNARPFHNISSTKHTALLVETSHEYQKLKALLEILMEKDSCPLQLLRDYGDWTKDQFWAVVRFLTHASRSKEIFQLFDIWKNIEKSRINEFNYSKIIGLLVEEDLIEEAVLCFQEMKSHCLRLSVEVYNSIIHGLSRKGNFDDALIFLDEMKEMNLAPDTDTYDGLIEAYGIYKCMMRWKSLNSRTILKEDLIRKLAEVYIENYMFSRLENLGVDLSPRFGQTDLVWCLRLLSHAGLFSKRGMDSIIQEMEEKNVPWNATVANIIMIAYLKMKNFTHLRILFSQLLTHGVEPDIITIGILFDANRIGYDGSGTLDRWRKQGFLYKAVEMNTDPLVITTFGKGHFLRNCEEAYSSLEPAVREKKTWTYQHLIDSVFKHKQCKFNKKA